MTSEYESHPAFCEDSDGLCMIKHERDRYKAALELILGFSDLEMGDGDGARDAAKEALGLHMTYEEWLKSQL